MGINRGPRVIILVSCAILYCIGAWYAYSALNPPNQSFPEKSLRTILDNLRSQSSQRSPSKSVYPEYSCRPSIPISINFFSSPSTSSESQKLITNNINTSLSPRRVSAVLSIKPSVSFYTYKAKDEEEETDIFVLVRKLNSFLPQPSSEEEAANQPPTVLIYHNPRKTDEKLKQTVSGVALSSSSLLLFPLTDTPDWMDISNKIDQWLIRYHFGDNAHDKDETTLALEVNDACLSDAVKLLEQTITSMKSSISLGRITVTPSVVEAAHHVVDTFNNKKSVDDTTTENWKESLMHSKSVWHAVHALSRHGDLGSKPVMPREHALALLLPLGLPIFLAIVQASMREVKRKENSDKKKN